MKKLFAIAVLALSTTFVSAQNQGTPYMFTGKLITTPAVVPSCGGNDVGAAYEFEITMFSDESYAQQNVAIVFKCPESLGTDFFKVGSSYKMEVFVNPNGNFSIANQNVVDAYNWATTYYAGDIKRIQ